jgi:hypothetical protein
MFSTGKIGLWSVIEEGIGIFAGSLPALRPLLSLACLGGRSRNDSSPTPQPGSIFKQPNSRRKPRGTDVDLETFQQLGDKEEGDGESQKHILKETHVTMTSKARSPGPNEWEKSQVLGWKSRSMSAGS